MYARKFRPQKPDLKNNIRRRLMGCYEGTYNFEERIVRRWPANYNSNQINIAKQLIHLHYLARHSPGRLSKKWEVAYNNFQNKHLALKGKNISLRYLRNHTCDAWL